MINGINVVTNFDNQQENEFCYFRGFFRQHLLQTHHVAEAGEKAEDSKNGGAGQAWSSTTSVTNEFLVIYSAGRVIYLGDILVST